MEDATTPKQHFVKAYLLALLGEPQLVELGSEVREQTIPILFTAKPKPPISESKPAANPQTLGKLERMASGNCLSEPANPEQFPQEYLGEMLADSGQVEFNKKIVNPISSVELWYRDPKTPSNRAIDLGLLGKIAAKPCGITRFENEPDENEVNQCLSKILSVNRQLEKIAKREKKPFREKDWPLMWILAPTLSPQLRQGYRAEEDKGKKWPQGCYFLAPFMTAVLVALDELPVTEETRFLRFLGNEDTKKPALEELMNLPDSHPVKRFILQQ